MKKQENDKTLMIHYFGIPGTAATAKMSEPPTLPMVPTACTVQEPCAEHHGAGQGPLSSFQDCYFCKIRNDPLFWHGPDWEIGQISNVCRGISNKPQAVLGARALKF